MSGKKISIGIIDFMMIKLFRISPRSSTHPGRVKKASCHMMRVGPRVEILDNKNGFVLVLVLQEGYIKRNKSFECREVLDVGK